jgi:SAM-dependent methyltransferase
VRDLQKAIQILRREGVRKMVSNTALALRVRAQAPYERRFDETYKVKTEGIIELDDLTVQGPNKSLGSEYVPSPSRLVDAALSWLPEDLSNFTFYDFGSGKGRVLMLAARKGFKRVHGVEFARELFDQSIHNIESFAALNPDATPIDVLNCDAADAAIPDGEIVFFFYNPFRKEVMQRVLRNIEDSYRDRPRKLYIIHLALIDEHECGNDADANRKMLERTPWLTKPEITGNCSNPMIALMFGSFRLDIFETAEPEGTGGRCRR